MDRTDQFRFAYSFMEINKAYGAKCYQQMMKLGVHPGQIPLLMILAKGEMSQKEVARELHVKPPTVQRMEKAGFVSRRQDEKDQRISRIRLTDKGLEMREKVLAHVEENDSYILQNFSDTEKCLLERFLKQIIENIKSIP